MKHTYAVSVYDCSFVQDYIVNYTRFFDDENDAKSYAVGLMDDFANRGLYEYTVELSVATHCRGQFMTYGFWEFDCLSYDGDLADMIDTLSYMADGTGAYSYHDMF